MKKYSVPVVQHRIQGKVRYLYGLPYRTLTKVPYIVKSGESKQPPEGDYCTIRRGPDKGPKLPGPRSSSRCFSLPPPVLENNLFVDEAAVR